MNDVIKYLKSLNIGNDYIVAGISSGPDSMCLLDILLSLGYKVIVAHVNHNVRKQSKIEEEYLREYCLKRKVIFEYMKIENYNDTNFHKDARDIRYDFYRQLICKYNAKYLMTAHHGDDLVETILMRLVRGSSFVGYSGFQIINQENKYYIVRPLLTKTKLQIINYLKDKNIKYYIDETNTSDAYTRNRYRKYILPKLKEEDENVHFKFIKFSSMIKKYDTFINNYVTKKMNKIFIKKKLNIQLFNKEDELIQERIIENILSNLYDNDIYLLNDKHKKILLNLIKNSKSNIDVILPKNLHVIKSYDKLLFEFDLKEKKSFNYILLDNQLLDNGYLIAKVNSSNDLSNNTIRILSTEIKLPICIRNRLDGDTMIVKNLNGHKKVKDILINEKVDKLSRDELPIVTDTNGIILWIPGIKKSNLDKSINDKYDIILEYKKRGKKYEE